jgi:hypothetical protein
MGDLLFKWFSMRVSLLLRVFALEETQIDRFNSDGNYANLHSIR